MVLAPCVNSAAKVTSANGFRDDGPFNRISYCNHRSHKGISISFCCSALARLVIAPAAPAATSFIASRRFILHLTRTPAYIALRPFALNREIMQTQNREEQALAEQFLGTWTLVSAENLQPSGELLHPYGTHPSGRLVYQSGGYMSAQVSVGNPSRLASDNFDQASAEEASTAWRNYIGYWGTFTVDAVKNTVVHHVAGSSFANWIGTDQVRNFHFDERGHLVLSTETPAGRYILTWQRNSI